MWACERLVSLVVAATVGDPDTQWVLWLASCAGGIAFGMFTASALTQIIARVWAEAATSVSGLLPTARQLGGDAGRHARRPLGGVSPGP